MKLQNKVFLLTACIVVGCTAFGGFLVQLRMQRAMLAEAERDLGVTRDAIEQFARDRRLRREDQARLVSQLSPITEALAAGDAPSVQQTVEDLYARRLQIDLIAVFDARGAMMAAVGFGGPEHDAGTVPPASVQPIRSALFEAAAGSGGDSAPPVPAQGIWVLGDDIVEIAAAPVISEEGAPVGAVVLGARLGDTIADQLRRSSQSQILILADDQPVASSMPAPQTQAAMARFSDLGNELVETPPRQITVGGTTYLAQVSSMGIDYGGAFCHHVVLRSLQGSLDLRTSILHYLALVTILAVGLSFAAAWLGARQISQPLHRLAGTMSRIARSGKLERPEPVGGGLEVRLFQEAFGRMLEALEESQADRERSYVEAVSAVMAAVDRRDQESAGHSYRVAYYAVALAREMGINGQLLRAVEWGALLHDVGKIAVPDSILRKSGPLTEKEWQIMRQHPIWGYEMLADVRFLHPALDIVYNHHERWDGGGYPRNLSGEQIPVSARIFALVDTYDAITSDRHYRRARSHHDAVEELRRVSGSQLDPAVVEAFLRIPYVELRRLRGLSQELSRTQRTPPPLVELLDNLGIKTGTHG